MFEPDKSHSLPLKHLPDLPDVIAPDGSEIRFIESDTEESSMVHALLKPGRTTQAVRHQTVKERWICIAGQGKLWRSNGHNESVITLKSGVKCDIPTGTKFQFQADDGDAPLEIIITTTPPWPGDEEAIKCSGKWSPVL